MNNLSSVHIRPCLYFIENLTSLSFFFYLFWEIIFGWLKNKKSETKVYFIDGSKIGIFLATFVLGLMSIPLERFSFCLSDIRDEDGLSLWWNILNKDFPRVHKNIMSNLFFQKDILLSDIKIENSFRIFLEKQIAYNSSFDATSLLKLLTAIKVISWKLNGKSAVLFIKTTLWLDEIKSYALEHRINVVQVKSQINVKQLFHFCISKFFFLKYLTIYLYWYPAHLLMWVKSATKAGLSSHRMAIECNGHLNLQHPELVSSLSFFHSSQLKGRDMILLFNSTDDSLNKEEWPQLKKYGMNTIIHGLKAATISISPLFYYLLYSKQKFFSKNILKILSCSLKESWLNYQIFKYFLEYDYWYGLFDNHKIKIYVTPYYDSAKGCAITKSLEALGGVSVTYQYSIFDYGTPFHAIFTDIMFGFSKQHVKCLKDSNSSIPYFVSVGFLGDYRFSLLKRHALEVKNKMKKNGAEHIMAYFDENSAHDSRWGIGHEVTQKNYVFLLEKVLSEPWFGLIIKPKKPTTLRKRLGKVSDILMEAEATGRCFVFESNTRISPHPPAFAALASDIAVHGDIWGGTAGMESALAGVPTLYMDIDGLLEGHYLYRLGKDQIVFTQWENLWEACLEHWKLGASHNPRFDNWSRIIHEFDPFRDGKASERMSVYLKWLLDGFKAGLSRDIVMAGAAERYCKQWGQDKIVEIKRQAY